LLAVLAREPEVSCVAPRPGYSRLKRTIPLGFDAAYKHRKRELMTSTVVSSPTELADLIEQYAGVIVSALRSQSLDSDSSSVASQPSASTPAGDEHAAVAAADHDGPDRGSETVMRWPPRRPAHSRG